MNKDRKIGKDLLRVVLFLLLLWALNGLLPARLVRAASWVVTKTEDTDDAKCDSDCSLREAIAIAQDGDVIRFSPDLLDKTLTLTLDELLIEKNLTIVGLGASRLAISGGDEFRVLHIGSEADANISGLTVEKGYIEVPINENGGGGILNEGNLVLDGMAITNNRAIDGGGGSGLGGGIHHVGDNLLISNSTISSNTAEDGSRAGCLGGGIESEGDLQLFNVTISSNRGLEHGGQCWGGGLDLAAGDLEMTYVTIVNNSIVKESGAVFGGGLYLSDHATIRNSIIAGNIADNESDNCDATIPATSGGYNLEDEKSCGLATATDLQNVNPQLGTLQDNGGPTFTHALLQNSPAIDRISKGENSCIAGETIDQRGAARAAGDNRGGPSCDVGAYEYASTQQPAAVTFADLGAVESNAWMGWLGLGVGVAGIVVLFAVLVTRRLR
jgi:CSLREA domain-containing protein